MQKKTLFICILLALGVLLSACAPEAVVVEEPVVEEAPVEEGVVEEVVEEPVVEEPEAPMWEAPEGALVSLPVADAPVLDGEVDALWADAEAITAKVAGGANMGETEVTIKSVYSGDMVYFYVSYADPTQSFMRSPWEKQDDGTWAVVKDPNDVGHDNNAVYEDKMSLIWNIDNSIPDFETLGCFTGCHAGEDAEFKPYGNKYTAEEGQFADIWHWKSVRNLNQVDDQYLDSTRYSEETPGAGRHGDPSDGGGYVANNNEEKTAPAFMGPEGYPTDGSPGWILKSEAVEFVDEFVAGDLVPGIVKSQFEGDRGNISAGWVYVDGMWVIELGRALDTDSEFDVQYTDLAAEYNFGVAVFDNAQVRHAFQTGVNTFVFQPEDGLAHEMEMTEEVAETPEGTLVSISVDAAPALDGDIDALWADAEAITAKVAGGANMGETEVMIKSVYTDDMIYFYVSYADPTQSFMRSPWEKQEDGSWAVIKDPNDVGHDNNAVYEDKMSLIWNIDNSIPDFETLGCFTGCHAGEDAEFKPYGNKYTAEEGQFADIWHWKSVRNLNQVDDQYLDSTRYSEETAGAGRHGDPSDGGGYVANNNEEKTAPAFMGPEGYPTDGSPGWILDSEAVEFDDALFAAGDLVPGIVKSEFTGDRGNISAGWVYVDGMWVIELGRALDTGSEFDVQYTDLAAEYNFGVAVFDNAQVRHAFQTGVNTLVFESK